jgi:hypothetical protein
LNTGKTIEGTYEHPVLIYRDKKIQWERLDRIQIEDKICTPNKVSQTDDVNILNNIYNDDIYLEKVVNIEYGKNNVYDLTVEKYHSFIANNIFVHNTNAKMVKIGTPKTRNHFYQSFQIDPDNEKNNWKCVKRDWTQCPQLWALDSTMLPDPQTGIIRPYSTYVLSLMPKALKQEMFPNNPEMWFEGVAKKAMLPIKK